MMQERHFTGSLKSIMSSKQLFCLTYAGGSASFYDMIEKDLPGIDLVKIEYPGHGNRRREALCESFEELADDAFRELKKHYKGGEYALFGYSMGCITVSELMRRIEQCDLGLPMRVFLAAHEPQTKAELLGFAPDEVDEWVKKRTIRFGALPDSLIDNKTYWRVYLPLFRADYTLISKYRFENLVLKSKTPATVFYSPSDTKPEDMKQWEKFFQCEFYEFSGTHFFIQQYHKKIAEIIASRM